MNNAVITEGTLQACRVSFCAFKGVTFFVTPLIRGSA
nr:MAG TPA: hypothetical protein [Caudoviricetes sp.]